MPAKIYSDKDADLNHLKDKTVAVIGFGSQGHAHALNLKESGVKVIVGLYPGSKSIDAAKKFGFEVLDTAEAVKKADIIFVATPDITIASVYEKDIAPNLTKGKTLLFSHGFAIHFKTVTPPKDIAVIMVAPKGPVIWYAVSTRRAAASPRSSLFIRTRTRTRRNSRWPGPRASAARAPESLRPASRKRPRPICSANRPCSAAAPARW